METIERKLDENEQAQRQSQREQDGSEVLSVELERLIALGQTLSERRNAFEYSRDEAAHGSPDHQVAVAPALRLAGQPGDHDRSDDRLARLH